MVATKGYSKVEDFESPSEWLFLPSFIGGLLHNVPEGFQLQPLASQPIAQ